MDGYTMAKLIADAGSWFTQFIAWAGEIAAAVVANPLYLAPIVIGFGFTGVSLFKRLIHR